MTEYLMNTWYMGAWSDEISDQPLSRILLGERTLFYRKANGDVVAMRDRCPHRFAQLSLGKVVDDVVQCPYHGLKFNANGQCIQNPLSFNPPKVVQVQTFPVVERDHIIWFWPGDPEKADPSLIADFSYLSDPAYKHVFGVTKVNAHFELETDNLMDLSHIEFVHPPFMGTLSSRSKFTAERVGNEVRTQWLSEAANNPIIFETGPYPTNGGLIDHWLEMRWNPPGSMILTVSATKTGEPRGQGYTMPGAHIVAPETAKTCFYFWASSLHADDDVPLDAFRENFIQVFEQEDRPMIESVAEAMGDETDILAMRPLLLKSDAGSVLARRVLAELIARERESRTVAEPVERANVPAK